MITAGHGQPVRAQPLSSARERALTQRRLPTRTRRALEHVTQKRRLARLRLTCHMHANRARTDELPSWRGRSRAHAEGGNSPSTIRFFLDTDLRFDTLFRISSQRLDVDELAITASREIEERRKGQHEGQMVEVRGDKRGGGQRGTCHGPAVPNYREETDARERWLHGS